MNVQAITVGAFQENCYLVVDDRTNHAVIVDPGSEGDRLVETIDRSGAQLHAIWITHAHVDHVGAVASVKRKWDVPIYLHPLDRRLYEAASRQAEVYGVPFEEPPPVTILSAGAFSRSLWHVVQAALSNTDFAPRGRWCATTRRKTGRDRIVSRSPQERWTNRWWLGQQPAQALRARSNR